MWSGSFTARTPRPSTASTRAPGANGSKRRSSSSTVASPPRGKSGTTAVVRVRSSASAVRPRARVRPRATPRGKECGAGVTGVSRLPAPATDTMASTTAGARARDASGRRRSTSGGGSNPHAPRGRPPVRAPPHARRRNSAAPGRGRQPWDRSSLARRQLGAEAAQAAQVDAGAGGDEQRERPAHAGERLAGAGHLAELPGGVGERAEERRDDEDAVHGGDRAGAAGRGGHVRPCYDGPRYCKEVLAWAASGNSFQGGRRGWARSSWRSP